MLNQGSAKILVQTVVHMKALSIQGPSYGLGQSDQLFSALVWSAGVKLFLPSFRFIYKQQIHVGFIKFYDIWGLPEQFS